MATAKVKQLNRVVYRCTSCGILQTVESMGYVISGPVCRHCNKHMKRLKQVKPSKQLQLDVQLIQQSPIPVIEKRASNSREKKKLWLEQENQQLTLNIE